jgi:hypothetical protein
MNRVRYKLNKNKSKTSINLDANNSISLISETKLLPANEFTHIVNEIGQFNKEREESKRYRLISTINPLISNVLFNLKSDEVPKDFGLPPSNDDLNEFKSYGWEIFNKNIFKQDILKTQASVGDTVILDNDLLGRQDFTFEEAIKKHLREINGWFGFYDPDETKAADCSFYEMEPTSKRFEFNNNVNKNWDLTVTYPFESDDSHYLVKNGLLITTINRREFGGRNLIALGTVVNHNLIAGDRVRISNMPDSALNGDYDVLGLGLDNGDYMNNFFVINLSSDDANVNSIININFAGARMKRLYYGHETRYYLRKFKKINTYPSKKMIENDDYELFPLGFSKTLYNDNLFQVIFNEDIDISGLKDNLGRPITELYITVLKTNSNGIFTNVVDGFDLINIEGNVKVDGVSSNLCNIRKMHTLDVNNVNKPFVSHTPFDTNVNIGDTTFYGDLVEFSPYEYKETILSEVMHRFNTIDRENNVKIDIVDSAELDVNKKNKTIEGNRCEGYIYKPHHRIVLREYSNYVEQGDDNILNMPDYKFTIAPNMYLWRDLTPFGSSSTENSLDYPFVNGCHYIYNNIMFPVKRQDPFGVFDLYYGGNNLKSSPADINGDKMVDIFGFNFSDDAC